MDDLAAAVKKNDDVVDSAVTLITGLAAQLLAAKDDPVAIEALANEVSAKADALAADVAANTPAEVQGRKHEKRAARFRAGRPANQSHRRTHGQHFERNST